MHEHREQGSALNGRDNSGGLWRCPKCWGELDVISNESIKCQLCHEEYPAVEGIPDLRMGKGDALWEKQDLQLAQRYSAEVRNENLETVMEQLSDRPENTQDIQVMRVKQILGAPSKFLRQFDGWLKPCVSGDGLLLDVGCGSGGFLVATESIGVEAVGIDASMTNLIAAKRMIEVHGGTARLACAYAESLPIESGKISAITMNDSIEHVTSVQTTIAEAYRVLKIEGHLAISTPNRFSLTREPHVLIWGVGWLPRRFQARYVRWRIAQAYDHTRLMSTWELSREFKRQDGFSFELIVPLVPKEEIENFPPRRAALANLYNRICQWRVLRPILLFIGPFYQISARRIA